MEVAIGLACPLDHHAKHFSKAILTSMPKASMALTALIEIRPRCEVLVLVLALEGRSLEAPAADCAINGILAT